MPRKSKREIERDLETLDADEEDAGPLIIKLTSFTNLENPPPVNRSDSPHPELTVEAFPESDRHDELHIAVPNLWPEEYLGESMVFVYSCPPGITDTWPDDTLEDAVLACDLWDGLSDEDLREEYRIRNANADPIPPLLEEYV
jgi:hypothetical protein